MTPPDASHSSAASGPRIRPWVAIAAIAVCLAIWTALFASLISAHVSAIQSSRPVALTAPHAPASADRL